MLKNNHSNCSIHIENHPLSLEEKALFNNDIKSFKRLFPIILLVVMTILVIVMLVLIEESRTLAVSEVLSFVVITGLFFLFIYGVGWSIFFFQKRNLRKDIKEGKYILTSKIIQFIKHRRYGTFFLMALPGKNKKIRLSISLEDYQRYYKNKMVTIEFLRHSKKAIKVIEPYGMDLS